MLFPIITSSYLLPLMMLLLANQKLLSTANDTLNKTQTIKGFETLVSSGERFELGFFSAGNNSDKWYIGIWYKNVSERTPVWVANREKPVRNVTSSSPSSSAAALTVTESGELAILDGGGSVVWSTAKASSSSSAARNPIAQLLDNGNLVLREAENERPEDYMWQSFDYLTDTFLPDMDFGWNYINGKERFLSSWRSNDDPAPGDYSLHIDLTGYAQGLTKKGDNVTYRTGPWNGLVLSGTPNVRKDPTFKYGLYEKNGTYVYRQDSIDRSVLSRITINPAGVVQRWSWVDRTQKWSLYLNMPADYCDNYKLCGAYGLCDGGNTPVCACLEKFVPRDPQGWARVDWSNGCVRRTPLDCGKGDGFKKYSGLKIPDARDTWHNESMTLEECRVRCLSNCGCMAYTNLDVRGSGSGCIVWFGDLADMRVLSADGQDLYVRVASSELESDGKGKEELIIGLTVAGSALLLLGIVACLWRRKRADALRRRGAMNDHEDLELPFYDLQTILRATDNFSADRKLGEGGYGPVYKGILDQGQHIAVKRLSATSSQGLEEFKNEVICISKLQHRNLVKLLGYCIHGEEKMLIYEYMPNKSLDLILFNVKNRRHLDSNTRLQIVKGIARGLMYLHQDSPLRIVHRDLKASNILLNNDMNPKISDFGLARIFKENETEDKTKRVAGTYGYMSPEYAVRGRYSVKSDVFSFGVLVLEIVIGEKNNSFSFGPNHINLLEHAWTLHTEERSLELVDSYLRETNSMDDMIRLIHVGLLCVQQSPEDRPDMTSVVAMLSGGIALAKPKQPGFFTHGEGDSSMTGSTGNGYGSGKVLTITVLESR